MPPPQAQRPRQVPHLGPRARHPPPRTRLPRHRSRRNGHRRALRSHPPPPLDTVSRLALADGPPPSAPQPSGNPDPDRRAGPDGAGLGESPASDEQNDPDAILRRALSAAPAE